ncbi:unnamed protein product [Pleuronectes platessa]|uniref:Uncharacterized protein n=1 Tax=Pleuronectes platessa TaxID=8262 RepID=A0A9N7YUI0_PLEPL|nr:unnamed protein product [Pleuronectes platessa]
MKVDLELPPWTTQGVFVLWQPRPLRAFPAAPHQLIQTVPEDQGPPAALDGLPALELEVKVQCASEPFHDNSGVRFNQLHPRSCYLHFALTSARFALKGPGEMK